MLGLCEFKLKKWNDALEHLDRGKAAGLPDEGELSHVARYHRALLDTHFGRFEAALDELKKFTLPRVERPAIIQAIGIAALRKPLLPDEVAADDRPFAVRVGRAVFDSWAAQSADAAREFDELELTHPDNPHIRYLRGSFLLQSKPEEGLRELHKCLDLDPKYMPAMLQIAFESLTRGEPSEGIAPAENAVKLAPDSFVAHNALGRLLVAAGDLERGTRELQRAVQLAPENPECRFALASAYTKANRKQDAARENTEFLRLQKLRAQADGR
jgi:predicted Zn-dependent protease